MSLASLTTIAAIRDEQAAADRPKKPKKGQIGKVPPGHSDADKDANVADVLAKQIPTELIAPYTAISAALVGAVAKPTLKNPHPDQLAGWRWAAFILLLVGVLVCTWAGKATKSGNWGPPYVALLAGLLTATFWAFLMPGSPLVPYLHSKHATTLVPLFIALAGAIVATGTAALLTSTPGSIALRGASPRRAH